MYSACGGNLFLEGGVESGGKVASVIDFQIDQSAYAIYNIADY